MSAFSVYLEPLGTAAAAFPFAAAAGLLPLAIYHYYRHGRLHPWRAFLSYSFVFYLLAAIFLVLLPLPEPPREGGLAAWEAAYGRNRSPRLDPTGFLRDLLRTRPGQARRIASFQAVSNLLLLLPFGAYLVYLLRRKVLVAALGGLLLSLLFELCQFTGIFGLYPGPYRLFDAGDLLLNGLGALLGAGLAALLSRRGLLPALDKLPGPDRPWIGPLRRGLALGIDLLAGALTALAASLLAEGFRLAPAYRPPLAASSFALWLLLLPALDGGRGLGKRLVFCAIRRREGGAAAWWRILLRQGLAWGPPLLLLGASGGWRLGAELGPLPVAFGGLWLALAIRNLWGLVFGMERESWLDLRLDTRVRNTWRPPSPNKPGRKPRKAGGSKI